MVMTGIPSNGVLDGLTECIRIRKRDNHAIRLGCSSSGDRLGHIAHVTRRVEDVFKLGANGTSSILTTLLYNRPERVFTLTVGNHYVALCLGSAREQDGSRQRKKQLLH
jgi:hypothetical protein